FACLVEDTTGASSERPVELELIGEAAAGRPFSGRLQSGQAVRIATGGLLPGSGPRPGGRPASRTATIGVVGVEHAGARGDRVVLTRPASAAATRPQRQDLRAGSTYLSAGSLLHSASVGLAAAMGHGSLPVSRRPRVAI